MEAVDVPDAVGTLPRAGDEVDRYRVLGLVATGGMAAVFAAQRTSIGGFERLLALKVIHPHLAADRYFVEMFLDEARIVSQVHHANVVQVFDVVEHDGLPCIVMEFLHGRPFERVLESGLDLGQRLLVLAGAAKGLAAAHETIGPDGEPLGIIHRDVSPDNVHIGYDGHVKVVDFGIAAARGRLSSTRAGEVKGKLAYLAPEQLTASPNVTSKADVWSLGVMAWEALAGERLFADNADASTMWNVVHKEVPEIGERVPELDAAVAAAIMGCLQRDPDKRIETDAFALALSKTASTAAALADHMTTHFADDRRRVEAKLEHTLSRAGHSLPRLTTAVAIPQRRRTTWWLAAVAVTAVAGVASVAVLPSGEMESEPPAAIAAPEPTPPKEPESEAQPEPPPESEPPPEPPPESEPPPEPEPEQAEAEPSEKTSDRGDAGRKKRKKKKRKQKGGDLMDSPY